MARICILTNLHRADDDRIYYKQALSLATNYRDIVIVAPSHGEICELPAVRLVYTPRRQGTIGRLLRAIDCISQARSLKPAICHFHDLDLVLWIPFLKLLTNAKIIYDVHESYFETLLLSPRIPAWLRPKVAFLIDRMEKALSRWCDCIITTSDACSNSFNGLGVPVETIFNYPRLELFQPNSERVANLTTSFKGRFPVIYEGSISIDRGLNVMLEAMKLLGTVEPDIVLVLVGVNAAMGEVIQRNAVRLGIIDQIIQVGWIDHRDVVNYLYASKIGLVPFLPVKKWHKDIPIKIFEYMASGLPILGGKVPPIVKYLQHSGAGRVFDSTNPECLAQAIQEMKRDEQGRKAMGEAGKKAVQELWNWQFMERRLLETYKKMLG